MAEKRKQQKNKVKKSLPCGACVLIIILAGDLGIFKAYFFKMIGEKRFPNIRRLGGVGIEMIAEDIAQTGYETLKTRFDKNTLKEIRHPKSFIWRMVLFKAIDEDMRLGRLKRFEFSENNPEIKVTKTTSRSDMIETLETGESVYIEKEMRELLRKVIMELPPHERRLIYLWYYKLDFGHF